MFKTFHKFRYKIEIIFKSKNGFRFYDNICTGATLAFPFLSSLWLLFSFFLSKS